MRQIINNSGLKANVEVYSMRDWAKFVEQKTRGRAGGRRMQRMRGKA